jgi:glycosyltransferase involved in cell wall biosynthesis
VIYDITLLSTADWDNPFWTNKQHVAVELARRGHRVLYIDSLGLRAPTASAQDLRRILRRLRKALRPPRKVAAGLWVWSPIVIPFQRFAVIRAFNRQLLGMALRLWSAILAIKPQLLWTYNPMTVELLPLNRFGTVVYHCVDAINAQPGMPSQQIQAAESALLRRSDVCFATAESLFQRCRALNSKSFYFPNVADYAHFSAARAAETLIPADISQIPRPRVGFIGAISGYKVDFALLRRVAESHPEWSLVLIGQVGEGEPGTKIDTLLGVPNIHFLGPRSYDILPAYLKGFDVAMLPSMRNEYTDGMFPMKFFEYLAGGCPVVSTNLPALQQYGAVARLVDGHEAFIAAIEEVLAGGQPALEVRLTAARDQTYEKRTERMLAVLEAAGHS